MYRSLLIFFSKNSALKTIVIPLSTVFTGISTALLIKSPKCGAYLRTTLNWVITVICSLRFYYIYDFITFRTLLHLGSFITFRPSTPLMWAWVPKCGELRLSDNHLFWNTIIPGEDWGKYFLSSEFIYPKGPHYYVFLKDSLYPFSMHIV